MALSAWLTARQAAAGGRAFRFRILRNNRPIGTHRTTIEQSNSGLAARIDVDIAVTLAGLPVFRFTQRFEEQWRDGRLLAATAHRDRNGVVTGMQARAEAGAIAVTGTAGSFRLSPDAAPLSWWDGDRFGRPLFAIDTGAPLTGLIIAPTRLPGGGKVIRVSGDGETESQYAADGAWIGWRSRAEDGSTIVYEPD